MSSGYLTRHPLVVILNVTALVALAWVTLLAMRGGIEPVRAQGDVGPVIVLSCPDQVGLGSHFTCSVSLDAAAGMTEHRGFRIGIIYPGEGVQAVTGSWDVTAADAAYPEGKLISSELYNAAPHGTNFEAGDVVTRVEVYSFPSQDVGYIGPIGSVDFQCQGSAGTYQLTLRSILDTSTQSANTFDASNSPHNNAHVHATVECVAEGAPTATPTSTPCDDACPTSTPAATATPTPGATGPDIILACPPEVGSGAHFTCDVSLAPAVGMTEHRGFQIGIVYPGEGLQAVNDSWDVAAADAAYPEGKLVHGALYNAAPLGTNFGPGDLVTRIIVSAVPTQDVSYTGPVGSVDFRCQENDGTHQLRLRSIVDTTTQSANTIDANSSFHHNAHVHATVECGAEGAPTATQTPVPPTATATRTHTPTSTPTSTGTPTATSTPCDGVCPTATPTPTGMGPDIALECSATAVVGEDFGCAVVFSNPRDPYSGYQVGVAHQSSQLTSVDGSWIDTGTFPGWLFSGDDYNVAVAFGTNDLRTRMWVMSSPKVEVNTMGIVATVQFTCMSAGVHDLELFPVGFHPSSETTTYSDELIAHANALTGTSVSCTYRPDDADDLANGRASDYICASPPGLGPGPARSKARSDVQRSGLVTATDLAAVIANLDSSAPFEEVGAARSDVGCTNFVTATDLATVVANLD